MSHQLEIQPPELNFIVEPKKQSKCSIRLVNNTDQFVAFRVKTTSPKKYGVRPNAGLVQPKATCEFVVTMQALVEVPADLTCKDKFKIQSTIVVFDGVLAKKTFARDNERYIEERKMSVILSTPTPHSLPLSPVNGKANGDVESKIVINEELKAVKESEVVPIFDVKLEPINTVRFEQSETLASDSFISMGSEFFKDINQSARKTAEVQSIKPTVPMGEGEQRLLKEVEEMKLKLHELESKLNKTEVTTLKLTEEVRLATQERESLQQETTTLRKRKLKRRLRERIPLLFSW